ncbi:hypothetical protein JJL45_05340 [Tamlana sp. s12]|uniref:hypothetical protein n=1 Tax=Tamlana sp. s12 TaxID=1630406 RepID=UPI000801F8D0|nr:hypothetical protein [Tamlana sp. s12]OBQ56071.1 hypothetical protein VQ01_06720 [Tamlana sp. s12]QQY83416.1 hypothetical protein JJL45_05340 [Tamlana sp. s12]
MIQQETTTSQVNTLNVELKLRLGVATDFKKTTWVHEDMRAVPKTVPNEGKTYFLKSKITGKVDNQAYQINEDTDWDEFKNYIRLNMVYVIASHFELETNN